MVRGKEGSRVDRGQQRGAVSRAGGGQELQRLGICSVLKDRQVQGDVPKKPPMGCPKRLLFSVLMN